MEFERFRWKQGTYPVDLVETVHIKLPDETRELSKGQGKIESQRMVKIRFTSQSLCLRCCV